MANNQDCPMENGEDFSQDVNADQNFLQSQGDQMNGQNGSGDAPPADSGSADAPGRDDDRKLFVGGLSWETTDKELRDHFGQYGEIESINVKTDPNTGRSRGFAFIVFNNAEAIDKVVAAGEHIINNKKVDPKKAKARHGKIFVGGLTNELSDDDIKNFFSQYGTIIEVEMPFDKTKNQRKGFCFITFESEQVVNELLKTPKQTIKDKEVDVKKATPKPDAMGGMRGGRMMPGRGGTRGRGRGGYGGQNWNQGYGAYGGYGQSYGSGYDGYGGGYDYYGGGYGGYGGYDYSNYGNYDYGYGNYDGGYGGGRSGARGKGGSGGYQGGKQRGGGGGGGGRNQRHQPY
ncbi:RNA-binding protein squid isoform X1 [Tribolium castaneum]|uniref:RNA-binding protein squid-like Protein n=1 Tax=Tribolium castaneum TaxID=7070 RepID=D6W948_TRICA|nr:PREDICTED: RNA-binding protein squid isoform X1 [Tribolium castaneum]XP_015840623.1 PREDICTED: RNA-binding protein squid isoform X1 [Tribolium castaneum]EEZ98439.1 RNA-binding protein squid-like Protein [Tribolium castaneum]|eukprot:XP_008201459.1 PREDICTED: RNA-binding protein squid isoform X1 [Tribolium castaneum]